MSPPILATKLYIPPLRPELVPRPRLIERLNEGLHRIFSLVSAPAGFGKTTLVSNWLVHLDRPAAWLSLDEGDNDFTRFLTYVIAALQQIDEAIGQVAQELLQSSPSPSPDVLMTALVNDIVACPTAFVLVLDDYHLIDMQAIHQAIAKALELDLLV